MGKKNGRRNRADICLDRSKVVSSEFNIGYTARDGYFLFNTLRGNFIRLSRSLKSTLEWLAKNREIVAKANGNGIMMKLKAIPESVYPDLVKGGYLVPREFDEVGYLKFRNKASRFNSKSLGLTVLTTTDCNLRCVYCYESLRKEKMGDRVAADLVNFVKMQIRGGIKSVSITWYGGEPLMCYSKIDELSKKLIRLTKRHKVFYDASIITNGLLLTRERARRLKKLRVTFAQITLDGPPEVHDARRPTARGGSFDRIVENIKASADLLDISIRCNVDRSNVGQTRELVDVLTKMKLQEKVNLYFAPVHDSFNVKSAVCKNYGKGCREIYSFKEFAPIEIELSAYAENNGFRIDDPPTRRFNSCAADSMNSFVVEPDGSLYKCWEHVGMKEESIGSLTDGIILNRTALKWYNYDPFTINMCKKCKILPVCMGWCPVRLLEDQSQRSCQTMRFNLVSNLQKYYRSNVWRERVGSACECK